MSIEHEVGGLSARMEILETEVAALRVEVREITNTIKTFKGGWIVLMFLGSIFGGTVGSYILKALVAAR